MHIKLDLLLDSTSSIVHIIWFSLNTEELPDQSSLYASGIIWCGRKMRGHIRIGVHLTRESDLSDNGFKETNCLKHLSPELEKSNFQLISYEIQLQNVMPGSLGVLAGVCFYLQTPQYFFIVFTPGQPVAKLKIVQ